jgi:diguanylate cyclase (GGDEF)-like protein/PAS domain S-box-containing protein
VSDIIVVFEPGGAVTYVSPAFERTLGTRPDPEHLLADDLVHPDDLQSAYKFFERVMADPSRSHTHTARLRDERGNWHWFEISGTNRMDDRHVRGVVANLRDVTDRKHYEDELAYHAFHDVLTGLPNRTAFVERLELAMSRRREDDRLIGLLFLDVDELKLVNDSLGHHAGDHLLQQVAVRLRRCVRPGDVVARFGGDEFTVLINRIHSNDDAEHVAARILDVLRVPVAVDHHEFVVTTSIGIAVTAPGDDLSADELLRQADLAMYVAKERGRGRWEVFDPARAPQVLERLAIESELWRAVDDDELVVHFQPEVSLDTGELVAVEALVRWNHPQRGLLAPVTFVPIAEESNLILAVDRYVLRTACHQVRAWQGLAQVDEKLGLSVNLSPRFVRQPQAVAEVVEVLADSGLDPGCLQLEITERTALSDDGSTLAALRALRAHGIRVAIDDFGTGYSSLSYLRRFPVDVLKLDKSFVDGLGDDIEPDAAIIEAVITLGHALGIRITAEGVERAEQAAELRTLGCDTAQGFVFARPLDAAALEAFLLRGRVTIADDIPAA